MATAAKRKLQDIEELLRAGGYAVRYECGHFRAGHCVVHERRVIVVNKFFDARARLQKLAELAAALPLREDELDEAQLGLYAELCSSAAAGAGAATAANS